MPNDDSSHHPAEPHSSYSGATRCEVQGVAADFNCAGKQIKLKVWRPSETPRGAETVTRTF